MISPDARPAWRRPSPLRRPPSWLSRGLTLALAVALAACERDPSPGGSGSGGARVAEKSPAAFGPVAGASPGGPISQPRAARAPSPDGLADGPFPALFIAQAQFTEGRAPDGSKGPVPGAAKLTVVRLAPDGWRAATLEDPESNVFHKALPWDGGLLTIGATRAMLKTWRLEGGRWTQETRWSPAFGGRFDRLRDVERADLDRDGKDELVIATHDQGVIAIVRPSDGWRVEELDREPGIFVHEIEIGDVDGDGSREIFATPSQPNKLDKEQPGEVRMYERQADGRWRRSVVDAPGDTHAKEIVTADVDRDGKDELYVAWEGAVGPGGELLRPVTVKQYQRKDGEWRGEVVATVPDRQMRSMAAGDVNGDGKVDLVAGGLASGLWLFERRGEGKWASTRIDERSSGFEHPVFLADLDGDGALEIYAAAEDQGELRRHRWRDGSFEKQVIAPLRKGDITWNITAGKL